MYQRRVKISKIPTDTEMSAGGRVRLTQPIISNMNATNEINT